MNDTSSNQQDVNSTAKDGVNPKDNIEISAICLECKQEDGYCEYSGLKVGDKDIKDQVIWREADEPLWCYVSVNGEKAEWEERPFRQFPKKSWDGTVYLLKKDDDWFRNKKEEKEKEPPSGPESRGVACLSFKGGWVSITLRRDTLNAPQSFDNHAKPKIKGSQWEPSDEPGSFLFSFADYCEVLDALLFDQNHKSGLLVIMGSTSSGKSEISYGLMYRYLQTTDEGFRHVITLEDPIEKQLNKPCKSKSGKDFGGLYDPNDPNKMGAATGVEYTARDKKHDTTLKQGLSDCLRQKPTIVCVGEVRDREDWREIIDFAGTGHLVVATAHAGSLTEAMDKILAHLDAKTPAARSQVARKILGMVHLEGTKVPDPKNQKESKPALLISLWRRTRGGADKMMSEGIDSIAPFSSAKNHSSLGAVAVAAELIKAFEVRSQKAQDELTKLEEELATSNQKDNESNAPNLLPEVENKRQAAKAAADAATDKKLWKDNLIQKARERDLQGI